MACHPKLAGEVQRHAKDGADVQDRTGDLVLTKDALCQLSYIGLRASLRFPPRELTPRRSSRERRLERETGIEPATNSLEGCDSTTELLPPPRLAACAVSFEITYLTMSARRPMRSAACRHLQTAPPHRTALSVPQPERFGGEGRVRTSVARWAADLQSAAIDRSATSPILNVINIFGVRAFGAFWRPFFVAMSSSRHWAGAVTSVELAEGFEPPTG